MSGAASDNPPNSRLLILCPQSMTDADMRKCFDPYGTIEECVVFRDQKTQKSKGICRMKFSKASDACRAMEEMNKKQLGNEPVPLKVTMWCQKVTGQKFESERECFERLRCVFIRVPIKPADDGKPYTEEKIKLEFSKFGTVVNIHMMTRGKNCYVTFEKASQAATAIEQCDKDFSAVFVDPQKSTLFRNQKRYREASPSPQVQYRRPMYPLPAPSPYKKAPILATPGQGNWGGNFDGGYHQQTATSGADMESNPPPAYAPGPIGVEDFIKVIPSLANNPTRCREIYMKINYPLSRENAYRLCNLVAGLETLDCINTTGENDQLHTIFLIRYSTPASASWAWEKLQDLEYPPGSYVRVRYADSGFPRDWDLSTALNTSAQGQPSITAQFPATAIYSSDKSSMAAAQMEALQNRYSDNQLIAALNTPTSAQVQPASAVQISTVSGYSSEHNWLGSEALQNRYSDQPVANNMISLDPSLLSKLVDTLSGAASSSSSATGRMHQGGRYECSVKLSCPKPMLPQSTQYAARIFFLCSIIIPQDALEYAFSTFGDLISVYMLSGKGCGFIMYGSRGSADAAVATMNNATLNGAKLKILPADP